MVATWFTTFTPMKKQNPKSKKEHERLLAIRYGHAALQPLIKLYANDKKVRGPIWKQVCRMRGRVISRQQVPSWLAPKAKDWKSPSFASGILLLQIQEELCGKQPVTMPVVVNPKG